MYPLYMFPNKIKHLVPNTNHTLGQYLLREGAVLRWQRNRTGRPLSPPHSSKDHLNTEICPREGVVKEEKFPHTRKPSHWQVYGEFWNLGGQHHGEEKVNKAHSLTTTPSGEVAWTLASATSKWGLNRESWAALLRVRTEPECPEGNLRANVR